MFFSDSVLSMVDTVAATGQTKLKISILAVSELTKNLATQQLVYEQKILGAQSCMSIKFSVKSTKKFILELQRTSSTELYQLFKSIVLKCLSWNLSDLLFAESIRYRACFVNSAMPQ